MPIHEAASGLKS